MHDFYNFIYDHNFITGYIRIYSVNRSDVSVTKGFIHQYLVIPRYCFENIPNHHFSQYRSIPTTVMADKMPFNSRCFKEFAKEWHFNFEPLISTVKWLSGMK